MNAVSHSDPTAAVPSSPERGSRRPRRPDRDGVIDRGGVKVRWESYGRGEPTILFLPTWSIIHSRCWKQQISDFARRHRVLTFDPRGNGGSQRPRAAAAYAEDEFAGDALAVMDATGTERAVVVGSSRGAQRALILAGDHPARVLGLVLVAPELDVGAPYDPVRYVRGQFDSGGAGDAGWGRYSADSWRRDYRGFLEFFFGKIFSEPHSTKQIEDCISWGLDTDAGSLIAAEVPGIGPARTQELCARVRCPALVVHGDVDAVMAYALGEEAARLTGARLVTLQGSGHMPHARDPVRFNLLLRRFLASLGDHAPARA